jgi:hypothetical protein
MISPQYINDKTTKGRKGGGVQHAKQGFLVVDAVDHLISFNLFLSWSALLVGSRME